MDNPVTQTTLDTRHRTKTNKANTTQKANNISNVQVLAKGMHKSQIKVNINLLPPSFRKKKEEFESCI